MLHDRILVSVEGEEGERRSGGGILIPATASSREAAGRARSSPPARTSARSRRRLVLFDPEDRAEVEIGVKDYLLLRERDSHAVAATRVPRGSTGLYL